MSWFTRNKTASHQKLTTGELTKFAMLGTIMFGSKIIMEWIPNVHLLGMFTMVYTLVYREKGLIPIYVYILLNGVYAGFAPWWIPYLYLWTVLWGVTMLLPKDLPARWAMIVYPLVCMSHGLLFGTLYAPAQAILYGFTFKQTIAWIIAGLPWDFLHGMGNLAAGLLILPLVRLLRRLERGFVRD